MVKIIVLDGFTLNPGDISWKEFDNYGELTVYERSAPEEVIPRMQGATYVLTNKTVITRDAMIASPGLKYIGVLATGVNIVDLEAAKEFGITVTNTPAYGPEAVAQYAIALLLEITSQVGAHSTAVRGGAWVESEDFAFTVAPLIELAGKTCGIIGYGAIGSQTGKIAQALGMKVIAHVRRPDHSLDGNSFRFVGLESIYAESDIIFLHCPLTAENAEMINQKTIAKMKDGVILINNARGGLVNEQDLATALNSGKIQAAAVDTVSQEPMSADNPLLSAKNIFITPHISWAAYETRIRLMKIAANNLRRFIAGKPINRVC